MDPDDRSEVGRVSGQDLVPVADFDGEIVADSTEILRRLEELHPDPPLWPAEASAPRGDGHVHRLVQPRLEGAAERDRRRDRARRRRTSSCSTGARPSCRRSWGCSSRCWTAAPYLFGDSLSAADCVAFPFLKYAAMRDPADDELFHRVLEQYQPLGDDHPNLAAWIERVNGHPRALP